MSDGVVLERVVDRAGAARWHAIESRAAPVDYVGLPASPIQEIEALALGAPRSERSVLFIATSDGVDVGNAVAWLPLRDNLESAAVLLSVDPAVRRRGIGGTFVQAILEWAHTEHRSQVRFMAPAPLDGPAPSEALARRYGAEAALEVVLRLLDVHASDDAAFDALLAEHVAGRADGYEVVTWVDRVPDHLVDGAAYLLGRMSTDAPMGTIEWEAEVWDAARYREREDELLARGRRRIAAGAVERATGRLVAYTDIGVPITEPEYADQFDTIVDPEHRGHRLGVVIKVANLRHLCEAEPQTRCVTTWNAASNAHMVAINELLGFRPALRSVHWLIAR